MTVKQLIEKELKRNGLKMAKQISSGGFFASPTYDVRTVYTLKDLYKLDGEGFTLETDAGVWLLNAFLRDTK